MTLNTFVITQTILLSFSILKITFCRLKKDIDSKQMLYALCISMTTGFNQATDRENSKFIVANVQRRRRQDRGPLLISFKYLF